jgi:hypothetical protein
MGGPYFKLTGNDASKGPYKAQTYYTQKKPYVAVLDYQYTAGSCSRTPPNAGGYYRAPSALPYQQTSSKASDSCRIKFNGKFGNQSLWAVNLLEGRQSIAMIANRANQLYRFVHAVKRFRFGEAARVLGVTVPKGVSRKKQFSSNFLEFHFGWEPLVQDIGAAVETLQNPLPRRRLFATGRGEQRDKTNWPPPLNGSSGYSDIFSIRVRSGGTVSISNPDLYLANQLGFTNPLSVVWEAVPFSFVLDWFLTVGTFLGSMTARLGCTITNGWRSEKTWFSRTQWDNQPAFSNVGFRNGSGEWYHRYVGAISPTTGVRAGGGFSPLRALTAISLLVQRMR